MTENEFYIYPVDKNGQKTGHTICVIHNGERMFQGVALCSPSDNFHRGVGRMISKQRALDAMARYESRKQVQEGN